MKTKIADKFRTLFGEAGDFFASAGRINLIGEHTDYNGGFVFPGAVDKGIMAEIKLNGMDKVRVFALDMDEYVEFGLREEDIPAQSWARYVFGVCREIIKRGGKISGFDSVFAGDVPLGAGMSSSAALESTFAFALDNLFGLGIDKFELARIGQLLRGELRYHGPVRFHIRKGRKPHASGLQDYGVQVLSFPSAGLQAGASGLCREA